MFQDIRDDNESFGIGSIRFTSKNIKKIIEQMNVSKAPGPDGIYAKVIKECSDVFSVICHIIFVKSTREDVVPNQWK